MKQAFSLIELMIVIVILGLLTSLVLPNLINKSEHAKHQLTCIQMKNIAESLKMFKIEQGIYPPMEIGLAALLVNPDPNRFTRYPDGGYLDSKTLPKDPWKHDLIYILQNNQFDIISLGADGKEGGEGENSDIVLSKCVQ